MARFVSMLVVFSSLIVLEISVLLIVIACSFRLHVMLCHSHSKKLNTVVYDK